MRQSDDLNCEKYRNFTWCGNFAERHSFCIVSGDSPETIRKMCLSAKFPHQEIRWNYGIFRSVMADEKPNKLQGTMNNE